MSTTRPPFGVRFLSILLFVGGILDVIGGIVLLTQRNDRDVLEAVGASSSDLTLYGVIAIVSGVVVMLVASALRGGAQWARYSIAFIALLRFSLLVWVTIGYHRVHWYDSLGPTVIYALVAGYLLFDEDARSYFERA